MDNNIEFSLNKLSINPKTLLEPNENNDVEELFGSPYKSSNIVCSYLDPAEYAARFSNLKNVPIMSFNIQSLSAEKKNLYAYAFL
jgi:hypothetical protein